MVKPATPELFQRVWQTPWLWATLVVFLFCIPLFAGLDRRDLMDDEAIYSFSVDVMVKDGDWLTPKRSPNETEAFLEKPPLMFWLIAAPMRWGWLPRNEFGMRFWDAFMGSAAFLYVLAIGRRLAGPVCGFASVFLLFAHGPLVNAHGLRANDMEAALLLVYAGGMYHFLAWRTAAPGNRSHLFAIAGFFVLGFMVKFVAALFLPLVLLFAATLNRETRVRLLMNWGTLVAAALVAIGLIAPWFIYQSVHLGPSLFETMFSEHVLKRFTSTLDPNHLKPWSFYFTELWLNLRENGTALITIAGASLILFRTIRQRWFEGGLIVLWFVVPMGLLSAGTSKLYHYEYPFLPPVAMAGAYALARLAEVLWRWARRPAEAVEAWRHGGSHANGGILAGSLSVIGVAALVLAVATALMGHIRLEVGRTLIRNSSMWRPAIAGALAITMAGRAFAFRTMLPLLALLALMPFAAYQRTVAQSLQYDRPVQELRSCLSPIVAQESAQGRTPPGILVEASAFGQREAYYFRSFGPWEQRDAPTDAMIAARLFSSRGYGPVMLSKRRLSEFKRGDVDRTKDVGTVDRDNFVLLLPGPFKTCAK